jgi:uncharacterized protein (TIGR03790 family)
MLLVLTAVLGDAGAVRAAATPDQLAVIVNRADPLSRAIGDYYVERRGIPPQNLITVEFAPGRDTLPRDEFDELLRDVAHRTPATVQFYALTWARPYRVDCMSITSAFAFGFDSSLCATGCRRTRLSPYFGSDSAQPWRDLRLRPAMSIAATSLERAKELIDRGVAADGTHPRGTAYLVRTGDVARDVRAADYPQAREAVAGRLEVTLEDTPGITGRRDVMFYFTGAVDVPGIETNTYLPGAVADHLTSAGGVLVGSEQMSGLRWLEAGATGSYGAVVEPCNLTGKFPNPAMLMRRYTQGESLVESYWKSVAMPGQGIFIGEPLSAPYAASARIASGAP